MEAIEVIRHENIAFQVILKRTTLLFLPFAIIAGIIAFSIYKKELKFSSVSRESTESNIVNLQREAVLNEFDHIVNNLLLLSREFELHMTRSAASDPMELFGREFLIFSDNMRAYDQVRLLDETGMELIRVNLNGGAPYLVPKDELQFKGGRYYFNEAFQLGRREIYVSLFDLNMEGGKIEAPLKPMIRFATPVFYKDGRKRGIVIFNYLGESILNSLKELAGKSSSRFMLINSDGFWLVGPTPDDEWGFMYEDGSERRFDNAYPEAWQKISETESGVFYNEEGMFTYNTVYPSIEAIRANPGKKNVSEAAKIRIGSEVNYWKIVSYIPEDLLNAARYSLLWRFLLVYGLFAGLWAMVSWQLARISLHRKIAQERLEKSEASLTQAQHIAHLGNWEWDLRSDEIDWSGELFNILHLDSQKSHPGFRAFLKAVHPEDRAFVKKSFAEALAKKKPVSIDHRIVLPDSSERVVVHDQGEVVFDESGEPIKVVGTIQDVTLPKKVEETLRKNNELLDTIRHAQDRFLVEGNTQPLFDELLNDLLVLTESKYGFIGEVLYNSEGDPYLKTHAITDISWNDETRKFYEEKAPEGMEFYNLNSLFGDVMVTGEPVISNDPATDPRRSGLPEGHPSLDAFLGLPFRLGSKLVGMVGIANRPGGYDAELVEFLEPFILTCGNIIDALRNNRQRQDAEEALKQSEERFRSIFENSGDAIFVVDPVHDRIIEASPSACSMLGFTREELLLTPMSAIHPNELETLSQFAKTVFKEGKGWTDELSCRKKNGDYLPAEITASSFHTDEGEYMLAIVRDITRRKLMEQDLLLFRNLMDQTKDGIFINDAETGRILDVNESACSDMGYTRKELIGKRVIDFATTLPDDFSWEAHAKELREKGSILLESGHRRKDGSTFPVEVSLKEVELGGKHYNLAVVRDITERKQTEDALYFIARQGWKESGELFFQGLATYLAETLGMDYIIIGRLKDEETIETMAFYSDSRIEGNIEYELAGTPCEKVMGKGLCCYPKDIQKLFPGDEALVRMEAESYVGIPLRDSKGDPIGLIALIDGKPIKNPRIAESLLQIVAIRAAHEMERLEAEEELRKAHDELEVKVEQRTHDLGERVKELNCLYGIAKLFEEKKELDDILLGVTNMIPLSWQYPEITCIRIIFEEREFKSDNLRETKWKQSADIKLKERKVGIIEVFYLEERPDIEEGPFLKEERALLDEISARLGAVLEHRQAEEALIRSEERYKLAEIAGNIGTWDWNILSDELHWSDMIYIVFGIRRGEYGATYEAFLDFIHPDDRQLVVDSVNEAVEEGKDYAIEHRIVRPDKVVRWISEIGAIFRDEEGKAVRMLGIVQDITERKLMEDALRESEHNLVVGQEIAHMGSWKLNPETGKVECSDELLRIFGIVRDDMTLNAFADVVHPEDREYDLEHIQKGIEQGVPWAIEHRLLLKDGTIKWVHAVGEPKLDENGKTTHIIGITQDITERKQAEEQIKASLHEKEILLREVHHRVKNNMQVISSLLRMQAEKIKDEGYADMLRESQERIRSMSLLHEKLYQSKDFANVDFKGYVETLVNSLFRSHGVNVNKVKVNMVIEDIKLDLENAIPCGLIINELISNSLKYAFPESGEGEISLGFSSTGGGELELVVADNGVGIPEDVDLKDSETLGLYLVTMLAERQLEGEVEFKREGGTKCRISFKRQIYKPRI